jgi:hypothetical protein
MKTLFATAAVVASIMVVSSALAGPRLITENSASQNRLGHAQPASTPSFVTENSASQNRVGYAQPASSPRFVTENSASQNRLGGLTTVAASPGFRWSDAAIGASATLGAVLILLGGTLLALRKRGHIAIASR